VDGFRRLLRRRRRLGGGVLLFDESANLNTTSEGGALGTSDGCIVGSGDPEGCTVSDGDKETDGAEGSKEVVGMGVDVGVDDG